MRLEKIILLETALDHLTGEELGAAIAELEKSPAILDVLLLQGIGKKNRPAGLLQVLCLPADEDAARDAIFMHTHTLGIRRLPMERYIVDRRPCQVKAGDILLDAKAHTLDGQEFARPESDAVNSAAKGKGLGAPGIRFINYEIIK